MTVIRENIYVTLCEYGYSNAFICLHDQLRNQDMSNHSLGCCEGYSQIFSHIVDPNDTISLAVMSPMIMD